jgi:hypothetical protein
MQGSDLPCEVANVHVGWNDWRVTLAEFERHLNADGKPVEYAKSWLCFLDFESLHGFSFSF